MLEASWTITLATDKVSCEFTDLACPFYVLRVPVILAVDGPTAAGKDTVLRERPARRYLRHALGQLDT